MANKFKQTNLGTIKLDTKYSEQSIVETIVDSLGRVILNIDNITLRLDYDSVSRLRQALNDAQRFIEEEAIDNAGVKLGQQKLEFMDDPSNW